MLHYHLFNQQLSTMKKEKSDVLTINEITYNTNLILYEKDMTHVDYTKSTPLLHVCMMHKFSF